MGHTHYWKGKKAFTKPEWSEITKTFNDLKAASDIDLAGWEGTGEPEVTDDAIRFNGREPADFETFTLHSDPDASSFCKTGQRPYDEVVVALLLFVAKTYPDTVDVSSDGELDGEDGDAARKLLASI